MFTLIMTTADNCKHFYLTIYDILIIIKKDKQLSNILFWLDKMVGGFESHQNSNVLFIL